MFLRACLALYLFLLGGQTAVSAPVPPDPVEEPISYLDEPGGGGGGSKLKNCEIRPSFGTKPMYCVWYGPKPQNKKQCFSHDDDAKAKLLAEQWRDQNCQ